MLEAIIIGIIQGITEWLPISSQGMVTLVLVNFFNKTFEDAIYLSLWLHLGTLLAAIVYFKEDISKIIKNLKDRKNNELNKLTKFLIITTLISGTIGSVLLLLLSDQIKNINAEFAMLLIGIFLIFTGFIQKSKKENLNREITTKDSVITGLLQSLSAIPGISRSGITTATLLFLKHNAKDALKLSFLLSIPLVAGAQVGLALLDKITINQNTIIALIVSFITGLLSIKLFLKIAEKINFRYVCYTLGILSILAFFI